MNDTSLAEWVDAIADRFDTAWRQGLVPDISDFMKDAPDDRRPLLLSELIKIDLEYRWRSGQKAQVEDYLREFKEYLDTDTSIAPDLFEYARDRYPLVREEFDPAATRAVTASGRDIGPARCRCPHCGALISGPNPPTPFPKREGGERSGKGESGSPPRFRESVSPPRFGEEPGERSGSPPRFGEGLGERLTGSNCGNSFRVDSRQKSIFHTSDLPRPLGKFQLLELLGQGSFGMVFRARDVELDRLVAVKVPRAGCFATPEDEERFLREARSAAQLAHPQIVKIHEIAHEGDMPYIVSDFIEGPTLAQVLAERRFGFRESAELAAQIADALHYAHSRGIVHRDINPRNIMLEDLTPQPPSRSGKGETMHPSPFRGGAGGGVAPLSDSGRGRGRSDSLLRSGEGSVEGLNSKNLTPRPPSRSGKGETQGGKGENGLHSPLRGGAGGGVHPKLMDFGLARRDEGNVVVTLDGQILGTPAYMAPEQAAGKLSEVDGRSDVYSLGVVLYEMLAGERPFRGTTRMLLHQVLHDEPRSLRRLNDRIPRDLETICLKAMAKVPARRYVTAGNLAADLHRFLRGEPIQARPVGTMERLWRWSRRNPLVSALTASAALLLIAVAVSATRTAFFRSRLAEQEREGRLAAEASLHQNQETLSKFQASRGILLLEQQNVLGLLNLLEARKEAEAIPQAREPLNRLWSGWYAAYGTRQAKVFSHLGSVRNLELSTDGKVIATASNDRTAQVWNWQSALPIGPALPQWVGGDGPLTMSLSPDGVFLANEQAQYGPNQVLEVPTGNTCNILGGGGIFFSPLGQVMAIHISERIELWKWNPGGSPAKPASVLILPEAYGRTVFSPDGKLLITGSRNSPDLRVWDTATGQARVNLMFAAEGVECLTWNKDSTRIATGSLDHMARIWDVATGKLVAEPIPHPENVHAVAFSPDGKILATGCYDGWARLWNTTTGEQLREIQHNAAVKSLEFRADGNLLATGSMDGTARLWKVDTGNPYGWPMRHQGVVSSVRFHPDGKHLITASSDGTARAWEIPVQEEKRLQHAKRVWCVDFSPDGKLLATGCEDGSVRLWETETAKEISKSVPESGEANGILAVAFKPEGKALATGGAGFIQFYSQPGLLTRQPPWRGNQNSRALAFNPRGSLVVGAGDGNIHFWEPSTGKVLGHVENPQELISCMAMSPDGRLVAVGTDAGFAQLWDTATRQRYGPPLHHGNLVEAVAFSPDGKVLASSARDMTLRFWNPITGELLPQTFQQQSIVQAIAFHPTEKLLALGYADGAVRLIDQATGLPCGPPMRHSQFVTSVTFSKDGRLLASASFDTTARIWPVPEINTDLREMELRTWIGLGASQTESGNIEPIPWQVWQQLREELHKLEKRKGSADQP